jgi:hypothetical protein
MTESRRERPSSNSSLAAADAFYQQFKDEPAKIVARRRAQAAGR